MKVLIVDDMEAMRIVARRCLAQVGLTDVAEAENGQGALAKINSDPDFGLVMVDVDMPKMDGVELIRQIRQAGHQMPIIIVIRAGDACQTTTFICAGADACLLKMFFADKLRDSINEAVERASRRVASQATPVAAVAS